MPTTPSNSEMGTSAVGQSCRINPNRPYQNQYPNDYYPTSLPKYCLLSLEKRQSEWILDTKIMEHLSK